MKYMLYRECNHLTKPELLYFVLNTSAMDVFGIISLQVAKYFLCVPEILVHHSLNFLIQYDKSNGKLGYISTDPLPEHMMKHLQWEYAASTWKLLQSKCSKYLSSLWVWNLLRLQPHFIVADVWTWHWGITLVRSYFLGALTFFCAL